MIPQPVLDPAIQYCFDGEWFSNAKKPGIKIDISKSPPYPYVMTIPLPIWIKWGFR